MVTLKQVEQLDERVHKVVELVESLRRENARLCSENRQLVEENRKFQQNLQESERRTLSLAGNQELVERGLVGAIGRLESLSCDVASDVGYDRNFSPLSSDRVTFVKDQNFLSGSVASNFDDTHAHFVSRDPLRPVDEGGACYDTDLDGHKMDIF